MHIIINNMRAVTVNRRKRRKNNRPPPPHPPFTLQAKPPGIIHVLFTIQNWCCYLTVDPEKQTSQNDFELSPSEEKQHYSENTEKFIKNIFYIHLLSEQL